jgi:hypothetical protein
MIFCMPTGRKTMNHKVRNVCPVCHGDAKKVLPQTGDTFEVICGLCGRFRITGSSAVTLKQYPREERDSILHQAQRSAEPGKMAFIHDIP